MSVHHRRSVGLVLVIVALTVGAYWPAFHAGFIWDDDDYVVNNETLRTSHGLWQIWTDRTATPQYYPLVHSSFWAEYQLWQLNATGYHVVNVLIHVCNALLLWRLLLRLGIPGAWLIGLLFAVHPVHVESVAWVTERKNVLSGFFYLLAAYLYLQFAGLFTSATTAGENPPVQHRKAYYWLALLCFVCALLSKTVSATLPAALLVILWWKHGRVERQQLLRLLPMFVIGIGFGWLTVHLEKEHVGAQGLDWEFSFAERTLIAGRAICFYAAKLLYPRPLIFTYPRWEIDGGATWQYFFPAVVLLTLIGLGLLRNRIGRGPVAACCLFCGTLFPALGFLDVYPMRFSFVADHFQYLASIAMLVLYVQVFLWVLNWMNSSKAVKVGFGSAVVLLCVGLTWNQTHIYKDLETLWRDTLAKNPTSWMAHNNLGALLNRRGDYVEAERHLREAIRLKPGFLDIINNLGKAREGQGDRDGARAFYEQAIKISPGSAIALNQLGAFYGGDGRLDEARELLTRAIEFDPKLAAAYGNLGSVYASQQDSTKAIELYEKCLELDPGATETRVNLAKTLMMEGLLTRAVKHFRLALEQDPRHSSALLNLGVVEVQRGELENGIAAFKRLLEVDSKSLPAMVNLAYAYEQLGDAAASQRWQEQAARLQNGN
jgi:protein O-mannosyl-transferase